MGFTATPTDGSSTPLPMSSAVPDGTNTPLAVEGGPSKTTGGNSLAPVAVYQYDGYDVTQGTQADTAATNSTSSWSAIALLKGLYAKLAGTLTVSGTVTANAGTGSYNNASVGTDGSATPTSSTLVGGSDGTNLQGLTVQSAANPNLKVALFNGGAQQVGQKTMAASLPVAIASDQGAVPVSGTFWQTTQPVSGTVTANAGTGSYNNASVGTDGSATPTSSTLIGASDGTNLQGLLVQSAANPNLKVALFNGANQQVGQKVMASSLPVTMASDQSAISTTDTNSAGMKSDLDTIVTNTTSIATAANQTTGNSSLSTIATNTTSLATHSDATTINTTLGTLATHTDASSLITNTANIPAKGAAVTSASTPVNIASDQIVPVKRSSATVYNLTSTAETATGNSGDLTVGSYTEISVDINVSAISGTTPTCTFYWDRKGADGNYYPVWQSAQQTTVANQISTSIGAGMAYNQSLGTTGRLRWVIGGTTPSYTFSASVIGK